MRLDRSSQGLPIPGLPAARGATAPKAPTWCVATCGTPAASPETTTAAGHKREFPQGKVVTAANGNVVRREQPVKKKTTSRGSIDYAYLREQIDLEQVLQHLGYLDRLRGSSAQRTGPCPFHQPKSKGSRSFSVNLKKKVFRCCDPTCQVQGNALDLWALVHDLPLYEAARHLADTFHLQPTEPEKRQPVSVLVKR